MGRPRKNYTCRECGEPCDRRGRTKGGVSCVSCAIKRHQRAAREINARQGEYYDKWMQGMEDALAKIRRQRAARLVPADAGSDE